MERKLKGVKKGEEPTLGIRRFSEASVKTEN